MSYYSNASASKTLLNASLGSLLSLASLVWVCGNLLSCLIILLALTIVKLSLPIPVIKEYCDYATERLYRLAVTLDSIWIKYVLGIEIEVNGEFNSHPAPVVICNHLCGFDVAVLQEIVSRRGPMLKFLIKKELIWMPIIGWVCLLLDFPRLTRTGGVKDLQTVKHACIRHGIERRKQRGALLIFPEGTRLSPQKHKRQKSPFLHLLKPKSGGLKVIQQHAEIDTPIIDVTIDYGQTHQHCDEINLWGCMQGKPKKIVVYLVQYKLAEIDDIQQWINQRWADKDQLLRDTRSIAS